MVSQLRRAPDWRQRSRIFHQRAAEYDRWFDDDRLLFALELAALQELSTDLERPGLEIGVGPGRFAEALGISLGLDPALAPLRLAADRRIAVCRAIAEALPLRSGSIGTLYLLFTLCFVADPGTALAECYRALRPNGRLVIGMVPSGTVWGRMLTAKKNAGNPYYQYIELMPVKRMITRLAAAGFSLLESRSTLRQAPGHVTAVEPSLPGIDKTAGFVVLVAEKV